MTEVSAFSIIVKAVAVWTMTVLTVAVTTGVLEDDKLLDVGLKVLRVTAGEETVELSQPGGTAPTLGMDGCESKLEKSI